jgi:uncharacterized membrane protein
LTNEAGVEGWLRRHTDAAALILLAAGLAARLLAGRGPYLGSDEKLHLQIANAGGVLDVYRLSLENAHPPLFVLLLHFWKAVARSEWQLRLLPIGLATAGLWAAYRWASALFGRAAGLMALACLALLPTLVLLSAELRGYALMLCFVSAALMSLERALAEKSAGWFALSAAFTALALLSQYGAFRFVPAAFVYALARLRAAGYPPSAFRAWAASQAAVAAVAAFLYGSHVSRLRGSAIEQEARTTWLSSSYFHPGEENPFGYCARQTLALFRHLFSSPVAGALALALTVGAIAWLASTRQPAALLLALPFVAGIVAGLLGLYPYGGTRHSIDLALFASAAVGLGLARLGGERLWWAVALAAVLAPAAFAVGW